jgi:hypothetical protein
VKASYWPSLETWSNILLGEDEDSSFSKSADRFDLVVKHTKLQMENSGLSWAIGEEGVTVTLMALLFANARWAGGIHDSKKDGQVRWCQYSKNGSGVWAESESGADFAVILEIPDSSKWRLGMFQAKRASETKRGWSFKRGEKIHNGFNPLHINKEPKRIQFLDLVENSICLHEAVTGNTQTAKDLTWVHYVGYVPTPNGYSLVHHPVSDMEPRYQSIVSAIDELLAKRSLLREIPGRERVNGRDCWFDHLCNGWMLQSTNPKMNWLEFDLTNSTVLQMLPKAFDALTVNVVASPEGARHVLDLLNGKPTVKPAADPKIKKTP